MPCIPAQTSVAKRRNLVLNKGYCFNWLCVGHTSEWCRSRHTCEVCCRNHHTKLHMDAHKQENHCRRSCNRSITPVRSIGPLTFMRRPPQNAGRSDHRGRSKQHRNPSSHNNKSIAENSKTLSGRSKQHIFLPTALARVLMPEGTDITRHLLNSSAAQTVILKSLIDKVNLRTTHKDGNEFCSTN